MRVVRIGERARDAIAPRSVRPVHNGSMRVASPAPPIDSRRGVHRIDLRLETLSQLFNSMDPTPFHHRDLDHDAEQYIETEALEFPHARGYLVSVHLPDGPREDPDSVVAEAIRNYFDYRADLARRTITVLLQEGRISLLIGVAFLSSCLVVADLLSFAAGGTLLRIVRESLTIGGWVAMWRPMQIFLYEWWPLVRRMRIYRKLGAAEVRVVTTS